MAEAQRAAHRRGEDDAEAAAGRRPPSSPGLRRTRLNWIGRRLPWGPTPLSSSMRDQGGQVGAARADRFPGGARARRTLAAWRSSRCVALGAAELGIAACDKRRGRRPDRSLPRDSSGVRNSRSSPMPISSSASGSPSPHGICRNRSRACRSSVVEPHRRKHGQVIEPAVAVFIRRQEKRMLMSHPRLRAADPCPKTQARAAKCPSLSSRAGRRASDLQFESSERRACSPRGRVSVIKGNAGEDMPMRMTWELDPRGYEKRGRRVDHGNLPVRATATNSPSTQRLGASMPTGERTSSVPK